MTEKPHFKIQSGLDAINSDVPDIAYVIEEKLRPKAKCGIIGKWKVAKSFFAIQMGMSIAAGEDFLGHKTTSGNVLYINFEISEEMFQRRVQDAHRLLGYDLSRFRYITINELQLDLGTSELNAMMEQCTDEGFIVDVLVIDPRWKAITRDSNQDEVVRAFCVNLDHVIANYGVTVVCVHHSGVSTGADKAGKGSTTWEAWLDGWWKLNPFGGSTLKNAREIDIWSRDSERQSLVVEFDYPIFKVSPEIITEKKARTVEVKRYILQLIQGGEATEADVRFNALAEGHSEYAFWRARKELVEEGTIEVSKAPGQGNRKNLRLTTK